MSTAKVGLMKNTLLVLAAFWLTACAHQVGPKGVVNKSHVQEDDVVAELAVEQRRWDLALPRLLRLAREARQEEAARKAVQVAEQIEDWVGSLEAARLWADIDQDNETAHAMVLLGLLRSNQMPQAVSELDKLWLTSSKSNPPGHFLDLLTQIQARVLPQDMLDMLAAAANRPDNAPALLLELRLARAKVLESVGSKALAAEAFKAIWEDFNDQALAAEQYGLMLLRLHGPEEALKFFHQQSRRFPKSPALALHTGQVLYAWSRYPEAQPYAERALQLAPESDSARYLLASILYARHELDAARHHFLEFVRRQRKHNDALFFLGEIYRQKQQSQTAVLFYDAVGAGKHVEEARVRAAELLADEGRLSQALARLRSMEPDNLWAQARMARTASKLIQQHKSEALIDEIRQNWSQKPTDPFLTFVVLLTAPEKDLNQLVDRILKQHEGTHSKDWAMAVGASLFERGANRNAIQAFGRVLAHDPDDNDALYARALAFAQIKRYRSAIRDLERLLQRQPEHADAMNALGYLMTLQGRDLPKAESLIREALRLKPNASEMLDSLGWVLFRQGKLTEARRQLEKAWQAAHHPDIGAHLGEVLWRMGDTNGARRIWEEAEKAEGSKELLMDTIHRLESKVVD
jgi:tetratricopeptide (TPR) repeat protein